MKRILVLLAIVLNFVVVAKAQVYRPFRVDLGFGVAIPLSTAYRIGGMFSLEPKYSFFNKLSVGVRGEVFAMSGNLKSDYVEDWLVPEQQQSLLGTIDWWFASHEIGRAVIDGGIGIRPFIGGGLGVFSLPEEIYIIGPKKLTYASQTNFGGMLRVGVDVWHMRLAAEYNISGKGRSDSRIDYLSIKANIFIGGGKK